MQRRTQVQCQRAQELLAKHGADDNEGIDTKHCLLLTVTAKKLLPSHGLHALGFGNSPIT